MFFVGEFDLKKLAFKNIFDCSFEKCVREEGPFFCTIFALSIKYLATVLLQSTLNLALQIGNGLAKVTSYGNDTVMYLNDSPNQFECVCFQF